MHASVTQERTKEGRTVLTMTMSPRTLRRLGIVMEPQSDDAHEAGGVLNPAVARGPDGQLYLLPRLVATGNYSRIGEVRRIGRALLALHPFMSPRAACWTLGAVGLEALARVLGHYDYRRNRSHHVWEMVASTTPAELGLGARAVWAATSSTSAIRDCTSAASPMDPLHAAPWSLRRDWRASMDA
jgi:hypothetical protein